jgi:urea transport system permease protein
MRKPTKRLALFTAMAVATTLATAIAMPATAQTSQPAATQPADVEATIRALLPKLLERSTGTPAVEQLVALRDARVLLVFRRVIDHSLSTFNGQLVYVPDDFAKNDKGEPVGNAYDLFTPLDSTGHPKGTPIGPITQAEMVKGSFDPPRPVRNLINNALRVLGLKVNDADVRRTAARDLGNRRQADALPDLREVATKDPAARVRRTAEESIALILASGGDPSATPQQKSEAISALGRLESIRALDLLRELFASPKTPAADVAAAKLAIAKIERHKSIADWTQNLFSGLSLGSIYILLALGLAITFGLMGVINMAHGEMMMVGAITTWACFEFIGTKLPAAWFDWYYVIAFPASFLVAAGVGLLIEVLMIRHLYKRPIDSMLATIGVSYILIQAVRLWKGDNLGMRAPDWAGGNCEIFQDVVLPYARLFVIGLTAFCVLSVVAIFRFTRIGLLIRATVQNREMAQSLGVNTRRVDRFTFAFGAGLAGLAGYGIVLTGTNPTPEMGQTFIVKSFLTVVVGGVGKLLGVIVSGLGLGFIEKLLEPIALITKPLRIFDATWAQVAALLIVILFMQRRPSGLFPDKGRAADQADRSAPLLSRTSKRGERYLAGSLIALGLVLVPLLYLTGLMSLEFVNKLGYIFTFAICAVGLDLIWGYIGVLSLCQFMFFSIGGYCMGLYLADHGPQTADGIPECLSYVMSDVTNRKAPWFLPIFYHFPIAVLMGMLLPGLVALLVGITTFRSRVRGVYFAILTQAITTAAWLVFQKNDLKLGGTNGLAHFDKILGFTIASKTFPIRLPGQSWAEHFSAYAAVAVHQTRFWLYVASLVTLLAVIWTARRLVSGGFGRVLMAIRDDETRLRFSGYQSWAYKAAAFTVAAAFAGIGGMLYVPQKGIITPQQIAAVSSILVVAWVAVGGRGSLWGAVLGAIGVSLLYESLTSWKPEYWYFVLGGLFVVVPLLLPGGLMSLPAVIRKAMSANRRIVIAKPSAPAAIAIAEGSAAR